MIRSQSLRHRVYRIVQVAVALGLVCAAHASDGQFDPSFGTSGRELLTLSATGDDSGRIVRETADDKLLMGGTCGTQACLTRLLLDGSFDPNYGPFGFGYARFDQFAVAPPKSSALDMIVLKDGRAALVGFDVSALTVNVYIVRADGLGLDTSVGGGSGYLLGVFPDPDYFYNCGCFIREQSDGKLIVTENKRQSGLGTVMEVARIKSDLSGLDTAFGTQGIAQIAFGLSGPSVNYDVIRGIVIQSDGKIVVGGYREIAPTVMEIARLNTTGERDTSFGANGDGRFHFESDQFAATIESVTLDSSQRIVFGGSMTSTSTDMAASSLMVGRLTSAGLLDTTFNGVGYGSYEGVLTNAQTVVSVVATSDSIYAASRINRDTTAQYYFGATRLHADGTVATQFGIDGSVYSSFGSATGTDTPGNLLVTANGLVVAGSSSTGMTTQFGIARLQNEHIFTDSFE